jgi:branched-chain amino acid transport system substrate-binding protein
LAALAVGLAGCTAPASNVNVTGTSLTIYASVPPHGAGGQQAQDVLDAEQLAFQQAGSQVGSFKLKLVRVDGNEPSADARTAIQDTSAIAYIGELTPGASADSVGITNAQGLLQVSPTDTAVALTQSTPAVPNAPNRYYESLSTYGRTFARVVPNATQEAKAQVSEMQALHVTKLYLTTDGSAYGAAIEDAVKQDAAPAISVVQGPPDAARFSSSGADALFFGGSSRTIAAPLFGDVAKANASVKLFAPSALDDGAFAAGFGPANIHLYVSVPGFLPKDLTPAGQTFASAFTAAYHHAPVAEAIFGYEAISAVLAVLKEAGSAANDRAIVVHDFFAIKNRSSVLGTYSINTTTGDTSIAPFVFSRFKDGLLVPYAQLQG